MAVLGHALILDGQRAQGLEYLQRAVAIRPRRPVVWEALAAGFEAAGQAADAARCRREAKALTDAAELSNGHGAHRGTRAEQPSRPRERLTTDSTGAATRRALRPSRSVETSALNRVAFISTIRLVPAVGRLRRPSRRIGDQLRVISVSLLPTVAYPRFGEPPLSEARDRAGIFRGRATSTRARRSASPSTVSVWTTVQYVSAVGLRRARHEIGHHRARFGCLVPATCRASRDRRRASAESTIAASSALNSRSASASRPARARQSAKRGVERPDDRVRLEPFALNRPLRNARSPRRIVRAAGR